MRFHPSPIFAGIGQTLGMAAYFFLLTLLLDTWIDDWMLTGNWILLLTVFSVLFCVTLAIAYPLYLFMKKRIGDAIAVFVSMMISMAVLIVIGLAFAPPTTVS